MPDSQNPDHVRKIVAEFQLKGQNLIPTVTGEIVPTVLVADLTELEHAAEDKRAYGGIIGAAAGAGNQNQIGLSNVAGSGTLIMLDAIWVISQTADRFHMQMPVSTATGTPGFFRDGRIVGRPIGQMFRATPAAVVLDPIQWATLALTTYKLEVGGTLVPGQVCRVQQLDQNETFHVNFFWRERPLKTSEL